MTRDILNVIKMISGYLGFLRTTDIEHREKLLEALVAVHKARKSGWLWPSERISNAFHQRGLAKAVLPCLKRTQSVTKSARAKKGERPSPEVHFETCEVEHSPLFPSPERITLVDDVITRGSTMLGLFALVQEAYPQAEINCFAAVRTISDGEIDEIAQPVAGTITHQNGILLRRP